MKPEILAPAGSWQTLKAAAAAGADAVYFGGRSFNARRNAENFDDEALPEAIAYCHTRGIKAHITLNTLLFEQEIAPALRFAQLAAQAGADALIIQDLGLARLLKKAAPDLKLHASTQMSVHNPAGVQLLKELGFSRAVLARELSKEEIAQIAAETDLELEVFVHGALCMSVSGQCMLSAMIGGRSGNRGLCAQPCRLPFKVEGGTGFDLSLKDLSLVGRIGELSELGVTSLKIEGRMKRPEYVAAATSLCAKAALGGVVTPEEMEGLKSVFSRSGFTQGYFDAKRGKEMFGKREYEDVLAAQNVLKSYRSLYEGVEHPRVKVDFDFDLKTGRPAELTAREPDGNTAKVIGSVPEAAIHRAVDDQLIMDKLSKTGGTPFLIGELRAQIDPGLSLPVAELNRMRRAALEELALKRGKPRQIPFELLELSTTFEKNVERVGPAVHIRLRTLSQLTEKVKKAAIEEEWLLFLPISQIIKEEQAVSELIQTGLHIGAELPRAIFGEENVLVEKNIRRAASLQVKDLLCGNLGAVELGREAQQVDSAIMLHGDFGLNTANPYTAAELRRLGLKSTLCSFESTLSQVRQTARAGGLGLIVYGRLPLMLTRNCPLQNGAGCSKCGGRGGRITDRTGAAFTVICESGASELLNDRPLWMLDRLKEVRQAGVDFIEIYFTTEPPDEVDRVLDAMQIASAPQAAFTRGLYYRGVE